MSWRDVFTFFRWSNETQAPDCVSAQISEFILREPKFPVFWVEFAEKSYLGPVVVEA